jgi:hypothetical protein
MQEYFAFICLKIMIPCISNIFDKDVRFFSIFFIIINRNIESD